MSQPLLSDVENETAGEKGKYAEKAWCPDGISEDTTGESILVTRAEAVQMISRLFRCDNITMNYQCYSDVPVTHPARNAIASCCQLGIINPGEKLYSKRYVTPRLSLLKYWHIAWLSHALARRAFL